MNFSSIDIEDSSIVKWDKRNEVFNYGQDNAYPTYIERIINSSVTAKASAGVLSNFVYGKGFEFEFKKNEFINRKKQTPNKLLRKVSSSISKFKGFALHIGYNALYEKSSISLVPFKQVRWGAEDDDDYKGKVIIYDNWDKTKKKVIKKSEFNILDVYNPNPVVIQAQVDKAGGWKNYKGQVLYVSFEESGYYPLSWIDPAIYDADSEAQSSLFKNRMLRKGFMAKTFVVTKPFDDKTDDKAKFQESLQGFLGAENNDGILHFESELENDSLDKEVLFKDIPTKLDDKTFAHTESSVANNIRKSFLNIPPALIDSNDSSLFGNSGESLREMRLFYQEQTDFIREEIAEVFEDVFENFRKEINVSADWTVKKLVKEQTKELKDATDN